MLDCLPSFGERKSYPFFAAFRFAFFKPVKAPSFSAGDALNLTVAPAFTATFSPVFGLSAERFGVSRTVNDPKSGKAKRPVVTISVLMASIISAASRPDARAVISVDCWMTSVRNFFDMPAQIAGETALAKI